MSTFRDINQLRKANKTAEAYQTAVEALKSDPDDLWLKRAMAWVLYDLLKASAEAGNLSDFLQRIEELKQLNMPKTEQMFMENLPWAIYTMLEHIPQNGLAECTSLFNAIQGIPFVSCAAYSVMFRGFHQHRGGWNDYISFCDWWNFEHFLVEDYNEYRFTDKSGKMQTVMSLVEQAYIGYSNALLASMKQEKIHEFLPRIVALSKRRPDYAYFPYFISKLYLSVGEKASAFEAILPFVKSKPNDFWVWQCLGESTDDDSVRFACYSRALTCRAKPQMLVALKLKYAEQLVGRGFYSEARTELDEVLAIRQKEGWRIPEELYDKINTQWYSQAKKLPSNRKFYVQYTEVAEKLIYPDMQTEEVMVFDINVSRTIVNFVRLDGSRGFFNYRKMRKIEFRVGQVLLLKIQVKKENGFVEVLSCNICEDRSRWKERCSSFSGEFHRFEGKRVGLVLDRGKQVFLPTVLAVQLSEGEKVAGYAVKSYDAKQKRLGWTAVEI